MISKKAFYDKLLILACAVCNLSQIPILFDNKIISLLYTVLWVLLAVLLLIKEQTLELHYFIWPILFDVYCIIMWIFRTGYITSDLFRPINLSAFIMLTGIYVGHDFDIKNLKNLSGTFVFTSFIVAIYIYMNFFRDADWASSNTYLYSSKNSAGQIFFTSIVLILIFYFQTHKIFSVLLCSFFTSLIVMMKSRATIFAMIVVLFYIVLFVIKETRHKIICLLVIAAASAIIFTHESSYNLFINQVILNNKKISDMSAVTSNRDIQVEYFMQNFQDFWVFGTGNTYIESMPLAALMSYGVLGGIPVILFSLYPFSIAIKDIKHNNRIFSTLIVLLAILMWNNGIFEEQSPFGPGVKCYFLWLITGIFIGYREKSEK